MSAKPRWFCSEECCVEFLKLNKDWLNFDILTSMSNSDEKVFIDHVLENINKT
ncbi:hypothetical protein [Acidithiobacillus sp.]|uniref:hypothetical protein n=1 Tax=Acidithiobacillus sp. TaxID=1872118 RepID=UPI0035626DAC